MRRLIWLIATITLLWCGSYVFIYLYRWEWHRALMMASFFIATEVAVATALIARALHRTARPSSPDGGIAAASATANDRVAAQLRQARPNRFEWLDSSMTRSNVFITMVVGGGVMVTGLAWLLDRLAATTAGQQLDQSIAARLEPIAFPARALVAEEWELATMDAALGDDPGIAVILGQTALPTGDWSSPAR